MMNPTEKFVKNLVDFSPTITKFLGPALSLMIGSAIALHSLPSKANELETLLSGQQIPLTLPLKTLDNSWRRISISGLAEMADLMKSWSGLLGTPTYNNVYYTQGKTVTIANKNYLIAYRIPMNVEPINFMTLAAQMLEPCEGQANSAPTITMETPVSLSLLNLETIGSLNDIKVLNINQEIADYRKTNQMIKELCEQKKSEEIKNEPKTNIASFNTAQQAYFVDKEKFTSSLDDLATGLLLDTDNYKYSAVVSGEAVFHYGIPKNQNNLAYVGGVFVVSEEGEKQTVTIICVADQPGTTKPSQPLLENNQAICGKGTSIVYW